LCAITAAGGGAGVEALIEVVSVAIVTLFFAFENAPIAATRRATGVGAGVVVGGVAVVADLTHLRLDHTVTAAYENAVIRAAIPGLIVAIITSLKTLIGLEQVGAHDAVTAAGDAAVGEAAVIISLVAVIAALGADGPRF
jgi:hypothetical protein